MWQATASLSHERATHTRAYCGCSFVIFSFSCIPERNAIEFSSGVAEQHCPLTTIHFLTLWLERRLRIDWLWTPLAPPPRPTRVLSRVFRNIRSSLACRLSTEHYRVLIAFRPPRRKMRSYRGACLLAWASRQPATIRCDLPCTSLRSSQHPSFDRRLPGCGCSTTVSHCCLIAAHISVSADKPLLRLSLCAPPAVRRTQWTSTTGHTTADLKMSVCVRRTCYRTGHATAFLVIAESIRPSICPAHV